MSVMAYNKADFLAGIAAGRNMQSWPVLEDSPLPLIFACNGGEFYCTISGSYLVIDYGDGYVDRQSEDVPQITNRVLYHRYSDGLYTASITGTITKIWFGYQPAGPIVYNTALKAMLTPLPASVSTAVGIFYDCRSLESVPENLFALLPTSTSFNSTFYGTTALKQVPEKLFARQVDATDFYRCFYWTGLEHVPGGLFKNNIHALDFEECFYGSGILTVGDGLFYHNLEATNFESCFMGCSNWVSGGKDMFQAGGSASDFIYFMFNCQTFEDYVPELWLMYPNAGHYRCFSGVSNAANRPSIPREWR